MDTITVRVVNETELDADSADLTVIIEGGSVFFGGEAFKKAKELRALIDALVLAGLEESRVKLRSVELGSQSFTLIKSSSAKYTITLKTVTLELLPPVLSTIAACKGAQLKHLSWNYGKLKQVRRQLRLQALEDALNQAQADSKTLGVQILGIHKLYEESRGQDYNSEYITGNAASFYSQGRKRAGTEELDFSLGNSTTVHMDLRAEFRVSPMPGGDVPQAED